MATLKLKFLKGAVTVFALCLIGTVNANTNTHEGDKKEVEETTTTLQSNFLVNKDSTFEPRDTVDPSNNCASDDTKSCVYQLTSTGMSNVPDQPIYTPSQIDQYLANGWIEPHPDSSPGLYTN